MKYTRLYADGDGESHFEDVACELLPANVVASSPPMDFSEALEAEQFAFMRAPTGWSSDWHPSSARNFFVVLSGEWEVTASDGETRRFRFGSTLLVEDTAGKGHSSRVITESLSAVVQLPE